MQIIKRAILSVFVMSALMNGADASKMERDLEGKNIYISLNTPLRETPSIGVGDIWQFVSYVKFLEKRGANVVYGVKQGHIKRFFRNRTDIKVDRQEGVQYEERELSDLYEQYGCVDEFQSDDQLFHPDRERVDKLKKVLRFFIGSRKNVPVAILYNCAKNHEPERSIEPSFETICHPMNGVFFLDIEYKSKLDCKGAHKPNAVDPKYNESFEDLLDLSHAIAEMGGYFVSPDSGGLHFIAQALRGKKNAEGRIIVTLIKHPNERWREQEHEGNTSCSCPWYKSVRVLKQENFEVVEGDKRWEPLVKAGLRPLIKQFQQKHEMNYVAGLATVIRKKYNEQEEEKLSEVNKDQKTNDGNLKNNQGKKEYAESLHKLFEK